MVSNLVVRNKRTGYVTFVAKARVNGESRTVGYICGLGNMTQEEFKRFQKWAHDLKPQEYRKQMVLATDIAVQEKKTSEGKVAAETQKKTTVKRAPKKKVVDKVKEEEKSKKKAEEREKFRREYEKRHGIPKDEKPKKAISGNGIQFTGDKTNVEKRAIINERITDLNLHIANTESDIRGWSKGQASRWKIPDAKEKIAKYQDVEKVLIKQRKGLK